MAADPQATHNLATTSAAVVETLSQQLEALRRKTSTAKEAPPVAADPGLQEKLAALGYVASDSTSSPMPGIKDTGADPKDKVEVVNLLHHAEIAKEEGHFADAVPLLEEVIEKEPNLPIAYLQLGTALMSLKKYENAVPVLRKAVQLRPDLTVPHYQLGSALFETEHFSDAATEFEATLVRIPDWAEARFSLATTYARLDRMQDAIREYRTVIEQRPRHYGAHLLLGRARALSGDPQAAIPNFEKAAELQPGSSEPHRFLADAYGQLGRQHDAEREQAEARRLAGRPSRP
jgi:tetratricopeptide (TPR) repeat protein